MYSDETILTYGKYKGKMLKDIPNDYFINLYKTGGDEHLELKSYMEANSERFPGLTLLLLKTGTPITFICDKRTFPTKKDALDSIVIPKSKSDKKVPIRAYECPECSGWHLTSKEYFKYKQLSSNNSGL